MPQNILIVKGKLSAKESKKYLEKCIEYGYGKMIIVDENDYEHSSFKTKKEAEIAIYKTLDEKYTR